METLVKYDKEFFYHFMWNRGYRGAEIDYFWNIFISGHDHHKFSCLDSMVIYSLDVFNNLYGKYYVKEE